MSVILITNHDESIYELSEKEKETDKKQTCTYKSKFRAIIKVSPKYQRAHATMGLPHECPPDPADYLKKHAAQQLRPSPPKAERHHCTKKDNMFPSKAEIEQYDQKKAEAQQKNFVVANIKTVLKMKPKEPKHKVVIEPHGTAKGLWEGLEPVYIKSSVFAKTPNYLKNVIAQRQKFVQMQKDQSGVEKAKCQYITRHERVQLLNGLKHNWEELQKQYQGLPILTDTIPKKNRKSKLEAELKQLERDIVLIERHPYIYVYEDE